LTGNKYPNTLDQVQNENPKHQRRHAVARIRLRNADPDHDRPEKAQKALYSDRISACQRRNPA